MDTINRLGLLPEELINTVCEYLPPQEIRNFRTVSKDINGKSYNQFVVSHFKTTQIMITRESLQTLIELSENTRIGPKIKELQICLVTFPDDAKSNFTGDPLSEKELEDFEKVTSSYKPVDPVDETTTVEKPQAEWRKKLKKRRRRLYGQYMHDQNTLRKQGIDVDLLVRALRRLPAIESIALVGRFDETNPPWGARKIHSDVGIWPPSAFLASTSKNRSRPLYGNLMFETEVTRLFQRLCTHSLAVVLGALAKSGNTKLRRSLKIDGAPYSFTMPKNSNSRRLFPAATPAKTFAEDVFQQLQPALQDLDELDIQTFHYYKYHTGDFSLTDEAPLSWLQKIAPLCPNITTLSISGVENRQEEYIFGQLASSAVFPSLRILKISNTQFRVEQVVDILHSHSGTLEEFTAHHCQPTTVANYVDMLSSMRSLPKMVFLELIRGAPKVAHLRWNPNWNLEGLQVPNIQIGKSLTPDNFQLILQEMLDDIP